MVENKKDANRMKNEKLSFESGMIILTLGDGSTVFRHGVNDSEAVLQLDQATKSFPENTVGIEDFEGAEPYFQLRFTNLRALDSAIATLSNLKEKLEARIFVKEIHESLKVSLENADKDMDTQTKE